MPRPRTFMNSDVLAAMEDYPDPFVTATEIADEMDRAKKTILDRLNELEEEGEVERKKVGGRAVVWWLPERGESVIPS